MNNQRNAEAKFPCGKVVATANAASTLPVDEIFAAVSRHVSGDWGDCGEEDRKENELSLNNRLRLFSVYHTHDGVKFSVITEADRSVTTVLLPEDY